MCDPHSLRPMKNIVVPRISTRGQRVQLLCLHRHINDYRGAILAGKSGQYLRQSSASKLTA